jgi:ribonuclease E
MSKEIYITSTPHETRLAIVEDEALTEIYYERENEYTLAGSIYNGRVTRVLPGMQSSFVDIGLERDAFLYITDFMEETPDPEEFDTISTGDRTPRAPRLASGDESTAPRTESSPRSGERNDRGDRGGRGRRGGRDRDRNADRGTSERTPADSDRGEEPRVTSEPTVVPSTGAADGADLGEGAPGADGNRRWRGRRGRRRGRGTPGQPSDPAQENTAPSSPEVSAYTEDASTSEPETYHEFDGAAETRNATADRAENSPRNDRSSDRGRRN